MVRLFLISTPIYVQTTTALSEYVAQTTKSYKNRLSIFDHTHAKTVY